MTCDVCRAPMRLVGDTYMPGCIHVSPKSKEMAELVETMRAKQVAPLPFVMRCCG